MAETQDTQQEPPTIAEPAVLADPPDWPELDIPVVESEVLVPASMVESLVRQRLAELYGQRVFTQDDLTRIVRIRLAKQKHRLERAFDARLNEAIDRTVARLTKG